MKTIRLGKTGFEASRLGSFVEILTTNYTEARQIGTSLKGKKSSEEVRKIMSGKAKVYFGSARQGKPHPQYCMTAKLDKIIELMDFSTIEKNDKVAIKMHLGFEMGYQTVPVLFVRRIVKAVKKAGGWPFITDNPTAVYNAVERGYTQETCGCPLIPVSGVKDGYIYPVDVNFGNVDKLEMAGVLHDADVLIDLSHAKGHQNAAYGGAIKNLGMGGYAAQSRWNKIHNVEFSVSYWDAIKCTPEHAKALVRSCPNKALEYDEKTHDLKLIFLECRNASCLECLKMDKDVGCLQIKQEFFTRFFEMLAVTAQKVHDRFDKNKRFFFNFALQITPHCDCCGTAQPNVVRDIGILASRDIVAVETATLDLIAEAGLIKEEIPLYLKHVNLDPNVKLHPFQRLFGPMKDPYITTRYAEQLGMGTSKYELIEIMSPEEVSKLPGTEWIFERGPSFY